MQDTLSYYNKLSNEKKINFLKNIEFLNDSEIIDKYFNLVKLDKQMWLSISSNKSIIWTIETLEKYSSKLNWSDVSKNTKTVWDVRILLTFKDKIDWNILSDNEGVCWTYLMIELFKDQINWTKEFHSNKSISWNYDSVLNFEDYLDFSTEGLLNIVRTQKYEVNYFYNFRDRWDWAEISEDKNFVGNYEKLVQYERFIDWRVASPLIEWSEELILKFIHQESVNKFISENLPRWSLRESNPNFGFQNTQI